MSLRVLSPTLLTVDGWGCLAAAVASTPLGNRYVTGALVATGSQLLWLRPTRCAYRQAAFVNAGWVVACLGYAHVRRHQPAWVALSLATAVCDGTMGVLQWRKAREMKNTP